MIPFFRTQAMMCISRGIKNLKNQREKERGTYVMYIFDILSLFLLCQVGPTEGQDTHTTSILVGPIQENSREDLETNQPKTIQTKY